MIVERAHIVIVEDNPFDAEITAEAFKRQNAIISMKVFDDGEKALEYIFDACGEDGRSWPAMVLLDLKLPRVPGLEVLRRLRSDERTREMLVVVFTSSSEESDRTESMRLGANKYVVKPVAFSGFLEVVADMYKWWEGKLPQV